MSEAEMIDLERLEIEENLGAARYAPPVDMEEPPARRRLSRATYIGIGLAGGLAAGVVLLLALMIYVGAVGAPPLTPLDYSASILIGPGVWTMERSVSSVLTLIGAGILGHLLVTGFWGMIFGLIMSFNSDEKLIGFFGPCGVLFGIGQWLLSFFVIQPIFAPWNPNPAPSAYFLIYALFYGLPLGLWVGCSACARRNLHDHISRLTGRGVF